LKDSDTCLTAVMFKGNNRSLKFEPEDGMKINAHGYIGLYEPRGNYQFYVDIMDPAGTGALYKAYEQLKKKLEQEGLFSAERKKPVPVLPAKIGIVTSPTGAALRDILSVVKRRFENVSVLLVPSLVQGELAAEQLVKGIEYLNRRDDIDLVIISRGGGSIEDLWPFNEEVIARAIAASKIPVISWVGHETDFTIADFTADLRAPTPSAAAELAISSRVELEKHLGNLSRRLSASLSHKLSVSRDRLKAVAGKRIFYHPEELFAKQTQQIDELSRKLGWGMEKVFSNSRERLGILGGKLESLSPLKTMDRGYSIITSRKQVVDSITAVKKGDLIQNRLKDGLIKSEVRDVSEKDI
ncbi:MAG TPA: exodeoxyribonuclease VII large subunit, partial [Halanaerobiales bacterium]|nr:exodeoxyribonuclease VII large subunit [Halanaerobiales bacterium]